MASVSRKYDLYSEDFFANAYATFAQMRENDPVFSQPGLDGETPIWWVTRYEEAEAVLLDDERFVRDPRLALHAGDARGVRGGVSRRRSSGSMATCSIATAATTVGSAGSCRRRSRRG